MTLTVTPNLGLTLMSDNVLAKETLFNEAILALDTMFAGVVLNRTNTPPGSPADGDAYLISTAGTGLWSGHNNQIAFYFSGWRFITPPTKMKVYNATSASFWTKQGGGTWTEDAAGTPTVLNDLGDVQGTPSNGQVLAWNSGSSQWEPVNPPAGSLASLSDYSGSPTNGQYLQYSTSDNKWHPHTLPAVTTTFAALTDVVTAGVANNWMVVYKTSTNKYTMVDPSTLTIFPSLASAGDVSYAAGLHVNDVLAWNGASWGPSTVAITFSFAGMVDGPGTLVGGSGKLLRVDVAETALEFVSASVIAGSSIRLQDLSDMFTGIGSVGQSIRVKSGGTQFEYYTPTSAVAVKDGAGSTVVAAATSLKFAGTPVTVTDGGGGMAVVTVATPPAAIVWKDHGTTKSPVDTVNFAGAGCTVGLSAGTLTVTITGVDTLDGLTDVVITSAADGDILQYDSGTSKWVNHDLSTVIASVDGTALQATYELGDFAPPTSAMFPDAYQATGINIVAVPQRGLAVAPTVYGSGDYHIIRMRTLSAATSPWEIICRVVPNGYETDGAVAGLCVFNSSNNKRIFIAVGNDKVDALPSIMVFGSATGSTETISVTKKVAYNWLKLAFDGNDVYGYISQDGILWQTVGSLNATTFLAGTPDKVGLFQRLQSSTTGDVGALYTYYDDPDYPAAARKQNGFVDVTLDNLTNANLSAKVNGSSIKWDTGTSKWIPYTAVTAFTGLSDVPASYSGAALKVLRVNSGGTAVEFRSYVLADISNVLFTGLANGDVLTWDSGSSKWVNTVPASGGASNLDGLSDVVITSVATHDMLRHNGTNFVNWKPGITTQTADYTLALTDNQQVVQMNKATAINLTVPANATVAFPIGAEIWVEQLGVGALTIVAAGSVTINSPNGLVFDTQYQFGLLRKSATNVWELALFPAKGLPSGAAQYKIIRQGASAAAWEDQPYDVGFYAEGVLTNSEVFAKYVAPRAFRLPSGAAGSYGKATTAATGSTTVDIQKNGSSIGSAVWAGGGTSATMTISSDTDFAAGDILSLVGPATADATLAGIAVTLAGIRR